ncbi:MAG TPA: sigma 54-interacting transcriptional regulator [Vicinamibacterales bacterium]|nr:sigma 54-interacting transcriptional regulator [Vicinamibacterales bacterium]
MTLVTGSTPSGSAEQDVFDDLLKALACPLDFPGFFQRLSAIAALIVPHDEAELVVLSDGGSECQHAPGRNGPPQGAACVVAEMLVDTLEPRLLDLVPGPERGLRSGLAVPIEIDGRVAGALALFSRQPEAYSARELGYAERVAKYLAVGLAHRRLSDQAAVERQHAAEIEASVELLRTISQVLDIRGVFPRLSAIAARMLPHDALVLVFAEQGSHFVQHAVHPADFPDPPRLKTGVTIPEDFIIPDTSIGPLPPYEPAEAFDRVLAAGYRSLLSVRVPVLEQHITLAFWSKQPGAFDQHDVPMARRVAEQVALAISHEQLANAARQAAEARARAEQLESRIQTLAQQLESTTRIRVVGESAEWREVLKRAAQVAATDTTVLLAGESGTGKEVLARFVHRASARSRGPFVALNCAALPEQLLESELFGYERGAFTGAQQAKPGQIELAAGGVLFLDEVSEMSPSAQAKFLRLLQEREFKRLGGLRVLKANIRVIAATNRDLRKAVERGDFREDLYYRLRVFDIAIPPLRARRDDILPLSEALLDEIGQSFGRPPAGLTRAARDALLGYDWPGNVRELRNALERAAILCEGGLIRAEHLALQQAARHAPDAAATDLGRLEHKTIEQVLRECRWNKSRAARRLGLSRTQLYIRMRRYGIEETPEG